MVVNVKNNDDKFTCIFWGKIYNTRYLSWLFHDYILPYYDHT